jgi:hypothetical protein
MGGYPAASGELLRQGFEEFGGALGCIFLAADQSVGRELGPLEKPVPFCCRSAAPNQKMRFGGDPLLPLRIWGSYTV